MKTDFKFDVNIKKLEMIGAFVCFLSVMTQLCDILGVGENWVVNAHGHSKPKLLLANSC